eukprot:scaffold148124_cov36-Prasinocladus_malaysianus.AAC.1
MPLLNALSRVVAEPHFLLDPVPARLKCISEDSALNASHLGQDESTIAYRQIEPTCPARDLFRAVRCYFAAACRDTSTLHRI